MLHVLAGLDQWWLRALNDLGSIPGVTGFSRIFSAIGEFGYVWIGIGLFILATRQKGAVRIVLVMLAAALLAEFATDVVKVVVVRPRPYAVLPDIVRYGNLEATYSFPSAHASRSFAVAAVLSSRFRRWLPLWYSLAGAIALSRVMLGVHYPTDVIFGGLLGLAFGLAVVRLLKVSPDGKA